MLLYVYRLRRYGHRLSQLAVAAQEHVRGEFIFAPHPLDALANERGMYARLLAPGTRDELLPHMQKARILRVRRGLLVAGLEVLARRTKSTPARFRQTWLCVPEPIGAEEWPAPAAQASATGFHVADDDTPEAW